jgi:hypothetical protein
VKLPEYSTASGRKSFTAFIRKCRTRRITSCSGMLRLSGLGPTLQVLNYEANREGVPSGYVRPAGSPLRERRTSTLSNPNLPDGVLAI